MSRKYRNIVGAPHPSESFVKICHENISTAILLLPLIQSEKNSSLLVKRKKTIPRQGFCRLALTGEVNLDTQSSDSSAREIRAFRRSFQFLT